MCNLIFSLRIKKFTFSAFLESSHESDLALRVSLLLNLCFRSILLLFYLFLVHRLGENPVLFDC